MSESVCAASRVKSRFTGSCVSVFWRFSHIAAVRKNDQVQHLYRLQHVTYSCTFCAADMLHSAIRCCFVCRPLWPTGYCGICSSRNRRSSGLPARQSRHTMTRSRTESPSASRHRSISDDVSVRSPCGVPLECAFRCSRCIPSLLQWMLRRRTIELHFPTRSPAAPGLEAYYCEHANDNYLISPQMVLGVARSSPFSNVDQVLGMRHCTLCDYR